MKRLYLLCDEIFAVLPEEAGALKMCDLHQALNSQRAKGGMDAITRESFDLALSRLVENDRAAFRKEVGRNGRRLYYRNSNPVVRAEEEFFGPPKQALVSPATPPEEQLLGLSPPSEAEVVEVVEPQEEVLSLVEALKEPAEAPAEAEAAELPKPPTDDVDEAKLRREIAETEDHALFPSAMRKGEEGIAQIPSNELGWKLDEARYILQIALEVCHDPKHPMNVEKSTLESERDAALRKEEAARRELEHLESRNKELIMRANVTPDELQALQDEVRTLQERAQEKSVVPTSLGGRLLNFLYNVLACFVAVAIIIAIAAPIRHYVDAELETRNRLQRMLKQFEESSHGNQEVLND